jgi:fluoroacetyl-CoA thioesterase
MIVPLGARAVLEMVVKEDDTAAALGSGDVFVLGTPRVLAWAEQATVEAVMQSLPPDHTTVGTHVELDHLLPSPVGARVRVAASLVELHGRQLVFQFQVTEHDRLMATGTVTRVLVPRDRFLESAHQPSSEGTGS